DGLEFRRERALQEDDQIAPQLLFGGSSDPRLPAGFVGVADGIDRHLQRVAIEPKLVAEVIVDRGDVRARRPADLADGDVLEPARGEELLGRLQHSCARLEILRHSVRLKRSVPPAMATTEKMSRKPRSYEIASNPVFLSNRFLNACTA